MKLVCISNVELGRDSRGRPRHNIIPLTIGQTYECETTYTSSNPVKNSKLVFILSDNNGDSRMYHMNNFVTQDVWREMQLNKLI